MIPICRSADLRYGTNFEIFQRDDQTLVAKERGSSLDGADSREISLVDEISRELFTYPEALDTPEKQENAFSCFGYLEISREGGVSVLPYDLGNPCHSWVLAANKTVTLYQATERENPHRFVWQVADHTERRIVRAGVDTALVEGLEACISSEEVTTYLKDRRIKLIHDGPGGDLYSIRAKEIKSKMDKSKVLTAERWAVTVVVTASPEASSTQIMSRVGHASIIVEKVEQLFYGILQVHFGASDLRLLQPTEGVSAVWMNSLNTERFRRDYYQALSETMMIPKERVEKMLRRVRWEIAQQQAGTPKSAYYVFGSMVEGDYYKTIDVFPSKEIYEAVLKIDPPPTAVTSPSVVNIEIREGGSALQIIRKISSDFMKDLRFHLAAKKKFEEEKNRIYQIEKEGEKEGKQLEKEGIEKARRDASARKDDLIKREGFFRGLKSLRALITQLKNEEDAARAAGVEAAQAYVAGKLAEMPPSSLGIPPLIRVRFLFTGEVEVQTLSDNCITWILHKLSLLGKRLHLSVLSGMMAVPVIEGYRFVIEDMPMMPEPPRVLPEDHDRFLDLIRQTNDSIRIREAEAFLGRERT